MPGVNPPVNQLVFTQLAQLAARVRALESQQQQTFTGSQGQPIMTTGLVPGSNPAEYGLQFLDPATGAQVAFFGEDASGNAALNITGEETVTGTLNVTGNMVVGGTLSLPNGIINNAALADPVEPGFYNGDGPALNGSSNWQTVVTGTIAVPAGFSQAQVMAVMTSGASCSTAGGSYIDSRVVIAGVNGAAVTQWIPAGVGGTAPAMLAELVTGLNGGSITILAQSFQSSPGNIEAGTVGGHLSATATFLR